MGTPITSSCTLTICKELLSEGIQKVKQEEITRVKIQYILDMIYLSEVKSLGNVLGEDIQQIKSKIIEEEVRRVIHFTSLGNNMSGRVNTEGIVY